MNRPISTPQLPAMPAIVVHGIVHAQMVLAIGLPVTLLSAPGAAGAGGCLWWREVIDAARGQYPTVPCIDILDCADAPGFAMAALRVGQMHLVLSPHCPAFAAVENAASALGAVVLADRPPALDLSERGAQRGLPAYLGIDDK